MPPHTALLASIVMMVACSTPHEAMAPSHTPHLRAPVPGDLELSAPSTAAAGTTLEITVTDAEPQATAYLIASRRSDGTLACPPQLSGDCLSLYTPIRVLGAASVSATGTASWTVPLPSSLTDGPLFLQAVQRTPLETSSSPIETIEIGRTELAVTDLGVMCDGITDDAPALQALESSLAPGTTLVFPSQATCALGDGVIWSELSDVRVEGRGARLVGLPSLAPDMFLLRIRLSEQLELADLDLAGEQAARETHCLATATDPATCTPVYGVNGAGSNLMFYGVEGLRLSNIRSQDAWGDNLYLGYGGTKRNLDVVVTDFVGTGSTRNNLTLTDCQRCDFRGLQLSEAYAGNFDIEPDNPLSAVSDIRVQDSELSYAGTSAFHATTLEPFVGRIHAERVEIHHANQRGLASVGLAFVTSRVEGLTLLDNHIHDIDLRHIDPLQPGSRSLIDLAITRSAVIADNHIEALTFTPGVTSIFFIWNDSEGAQATHEIYGNILQDIPAGAGWCWNADAAADNALVEASVQDNLINGVLQSPNPGCD